MTNDNANFTDAENVSPQLKKMLEENADVIADFERENELLSSIIAGSAAALEDDASEEDKERVVSNTADMFESVRKEYDMPPKLFRIFIESCLNQKKFLMPMLAFAYLQQDKASWQKLEQDREFIDEYAKWTIKKLVPGADLLMDQPAQNPSDSVAAIDEKIAENDFQINETQEKSFSEKDSLPNATEAKKSAESGVDFDELARRVNQPNPPMTDLDALFGAAFDLSDWLFISRGELPNVNPYIASNAEVAGGQQMVRAFTDSTRLQRFARENNLTATDGSAQILTIPTKGAVEYLEQFIQHGVHGIWFNSDTGSDGFFIPLAQLRPIREHLAKLNITPESVNLNDAPKNSSKTALLLIQDGLGFPSGFVSEASYRLNIFCRVPESWTDGERLKPESKEKIFEFLYGANWRNGNDDGSRYVVIDSFSKLYDEETIRDMRWEKTENTDKDHYRFYLAGNDGAIRSVTAEEFAKDVERDIQPANAENVSPHPQQQPENNLAAFGLRETADGKLEQLLTIDGEPVEIIRQTPEQRQQQTMTDPVSVYDTGKIVSGDAADGKTEETTTVNEVGAVDFETEMSVFTETIMPILKNYRGSGEYLTLLRFEPQGISQMNEKIEENSYGAYLQIRSFHYLNPKNGVQIGVDSVHSNELHHVLTDSKLILSLELCKNLDNQTAAFYYALQGPKSEVVNLCNWIEVCLLLSGYQSNSH